MNRSTEPLDYYVGRGTTTLGGEMDWQGMDSAPRDGTAIELKCTYGVAPWFGLFRWTNEAHAHTSDGRLETFTDSHFGWRGVGQHAGSSASDEGHLQWRPHDGDAASYVDPTGGRQNDPAYWRAAAARSIGKPADYFEVAAARNARKTGTPVTQQRRPARFRKWIQWLIG